MKVLRKQAAPIPVRPDDRECCENAWVDAVECQEMCWSGAGPITYASLDVIGATMTMVTLNTALTSSQLIHTVPQ